MTDRIPESVMKEAEQALDLMLCNCPEAGDVRQESIKDIARALLARDQRAAEIARGEGKQLREPAIGHAISTAILTYEEPQP